MNHEPRTSNVEPRTLSLVFALAALGLLAYAALQMDRPVIDFVRTLHEVWIERVGDAGYLLGNGWALAAISGLFVAAGYLRDDPAWRAAGIRGWVAHAVTGVLVQGLKHGIGRPRPRLHREEDFFTGPTLESGLDSFPSGHASASFAVASVIAHYFPRWARVAYALAGFVTLTRVIRGSHFISDALVGAMLGLVIGTLAATPVREWKAVLRRLLLAGAPWLVVGCAALWLVALPSSGLLATGLLAAAGAAAWLGRYCL